MRCPRCQFEDAREVKTTLPSRNERGEMREAFEYFCPNCKLSEGAVRGESGFNDLYKRWHPGGTTTSG